MRDPWPRDATRGGTRRRRFSAACVCVLAGAALLTIFAGSASAAHYHSNCVGHGYVHGSSSWDNAFHARVESGCGNPGHKNCYLWGIDNGRTTPFARETIPAGVNSTCNIFSNYQWGEQASYAQVYFGQVFTTHEHFPH